MDSLNEYNFSVESISDSSEEEYFPDLEVDDDSDSCDENNNISNGIDVNDANSSNLVANNVPSTSSEQNPPTSQQKKLSQEEKGCKINN